jgi:hypothetical protein
LLVVLGHANPGAEVRQRSPAAALSPDVSTPSLERVHLRLAFADLVIVNGCFFFAARD